MKPKLRISNLIKTALLFLKHNAKPLLVIVLLCYVSGLLRLLIHPNIPIYTHPTHHRFQIELFDIIYLVLNYIFNIISSILLIFAINIRLKDIPITAKSLLTKLTFKNFFKYSFIWFIYGIALFLGLIMFIIPGIYIGIRLCLAPYIMLLKQQKIFSALKKSFQLTKGHFWKLFWLQMLFLLLGILFYGLAALALYLNKYMGIIIQQITNILMLLVYTIVIIKIYRLLNENMKKKTTSLDNS
jgi:hypothetical protein